MTPWSAAVALGGLAAGVALFLMYGSMRRAVAAGHTSFWGVLIGAAVVLAAGYGTWLFAEWNGDELVRRWATATMLSVGGLGFLASVVAMGRFGARVLEARSAMERRLDAKNAELRGALDSLERNFRQLNALVEVSGVMPFEFSVLGDEMTWTHPSADERLYGASMRGIGLQDYVTRFVHQADRPRFFDALDELLRGSPGTYTQLEYRIRRVDGAVRSVRLAATAIFEDGQPVLIRGFAFDVSELRRLEADLVQAQKLEALGLMAANVAHEINTPAQFLSDSLGYAQDALGPLLELTDELVERTREGGRERAAWLDDAIDMADLEYTRVELPRAIARAVEGTHRIATIVRAMKDFTHPATSAKVSADLNRAVRSAAVVASHEVKHVAELRFELGELPSVCCHVDEVIQVFLNLIVNAAHAIADRQRTGDPARGSITLRSRETAAGEVEISVEDDGCGITPEAAAHVFEPFFTTKAVGRGTGQGLTIARRIVVDQHGGRLWFDTEPGRGTVFRVVLPVAESARAAA